MALRLCPLLLAVTLLVAALCSSADDRGCEFTPTQKACFRLLADTTAYRENTPLRLAAVVDVQNGWHVNSNQPTFDYLIPTEVQWVSPPGWREVTVQYPRGKMRTFAFSGQPISTYEGEFIVISHWMPPPASSQPVEISAVLRYQACTDERCMPPVKTTARLSLPSSGDYQSINSKWFDTNVRPAFKATASFALMLGFGLLGGLILNVMPCVLPVLSLKILALSTSSAKGRGAVVSGALAASAGIVVSFWALAIVAITLRASGAAVGWGIQFQQPLFVASLAVIVLIFCLNLWGVFDIKLPGWLSSLGSSGPTHGLAGHFTTGLFTTLMATPCTAPFLGTALGFALVQDALGILSVFTVIGLGMASPYLLLALAPRTAQILPRPGQWMVQLRIVLGFLLITAAVWLLYVLGSQLGGSKLAFIQLSMLGVALFIWAAGQSKRPFIKTIMHLAAIASIVSVLSLAHNGRKGVDLPVTSDTSEALTWQNFDAAKALQFAANGQPVFVDVTADWCFTCKVNKALVLDTVAVAQSFKAFNVVAMRADWTHPDNNITQFLAKFGRSGVPFYILYQTDGTTHIFSEILSISEVIDALSISADDH